MKRFLLPAAIVLAVLVLFFLLRGGPAPVPVPAPSVAVQTITLTQITVPRLVEAYGSVIGGPAEREITLPASGVVTTLTVVAGDHVAAGQVLAHIAADAQSVADLRKAENAVSAASAARTHTAALLDSHLATISDLAAADQVLRDAQVQLAALRQTGAGVARNITAPVSGIVTAVLVPQGADEPGGTPLFRLAGTAYPAGQVGVPEDQAAGIVPGAPVTVTLLNGGTIIKGNVASRAAMLDPQTGLIDIILALAGPAPIGEPVRAELQAGVLTGYVIPRDAVLNDENGDYVFQQGPDHLAHRANVRVLGQSGASTVLAPTLNPVLPLITTGAYQLDEGMAVRPAGQS